MHDLTPLDPEARRPARVIACPSVDALAEKLPDDERVLAVLDELLEADDRRLDEVVVNAAGSARRRHSQPARRVARQHVALQHTAVDEPALPRGDAFGIEGC